MTNPTPFPSEMHAGMLIRRPPHVVYAAFVDPAVTTKFWFTHASSRLEAGKTTRWEWRMYGVGDDVKCLALTPNARIEIEWNSTAPNRVTWEFLPHAGNTFVRIINTGFSGDPGSIASKIIDSTQGFNLVLAGAKAWLEHGIELNLVLDIHPAGLAD